MKPLRAHVYEPHLIPWGKHLIHVQPKLNGIRALYQNGKFQSNDQVPFSPDVTNHIAKELAQTFDPYIPLDGELYVHGWKLQRILGAITPIRKEQADDTRHVQFHIFDVVDLRASFEERFSRATELAHDGTRTWHIVEHYKVQTEAIANAYYSSFIGKGYEGMMYRIGDCPYTLPGAKGKSFVNPRARQISNEENRVWHMLKRKDWQDEEFRCVGMVMGEGKHSGVMGALTCEIDYEGKVFLFGKELAGKPGTFQVGSGFTDEQRKEYAESPPIGHLIKVKYLFLSSEGIPQNPSCLAVLPKQ